MPIGAGFAAAGFSAAGLGVPSAATTPVNGTLPDYVTNLPSTGRFINFKTGDYAFTADGRVQGMSTTQQMVQLALTTLLGSSADSSLGQLFQSVKEQGPNFQQQIQSQVQNALAYLIKQDLITLNAVVVSQYPNTPDAGVIQVYWTDNATGAPGQWPPPSADNSQIK